jgi:hypothetical protein
LNSSWRALVLEGVGDLATMQKWREQFNLLTDQTLSTLGS